MTDNKGRYEFHNYGRQSAFSNFLPGISGEHGIPIWCYYVNRGQCITSFGIDNKEQSIMEFYPAHQAYLHTKRLGFRTLLKKDGQVIEPFVNEWNETDMYIGMNELEIREKDLLNGLETRVRYITLPGECLGGLIRMVEIINTGDAPCHIQLFDGMPAVIPYGVNLSAVKNMGQTAKAWMEVLRHESGTPFFHARASMEDTARVIEMEGGNFAFALDENNERLPVIVSNERIFAYDTSLTEAIHFKSLEWEQLFEDQNTKNEMPCCFFGKQKQLNPKESIELYEIYGYTESMGVLDRFIGKASDKTYFIKKLEEANAITMALTDKIATKTGHAVFDAYCRQTYLDNVLRGGSPIVLGDNKVFYLYSRKHGDIERDYNAFRMLPEFYSQGNGNFRDVNQNRRCDVQFSPYVEDMNIKLFYNSIQINGYNPLGIDKITYSLKPDMLCNIKNELGIREVDSLYSLLSKSFTPGRLFMELGKEGSRIKGSKVETIFRRIINEAVSESKTEFLEGYWTDHWTYNLDLVESFLSVYPEREEELLFHDNSYTYRSCEAMLLPRRKRYVLADTFVRQYNFIKKAECSKELLTNGKGDIVYSTLIEKLILLVVVKMAALDAYGMGIEMEGGKPGWYDALNGLPGLLGSSMSESYELLRLIEFTIDVLKRHVKEVLLLEELSSLALQLEEAVYRNYKEIKESESVLSFWNDINTAKEKYWEATACNVTDKRVSYTSARLLKLLEQFLDVIGIGIEKAAAYSDGISPTYFYYTVEEYVIENDDIIPKRVMVQKLPDFLEGPVRFMKLSNDIREKKRLYEAVKGSSLYDSKLNMYKVNGSLEQTSFELGRARAFTAGWLENESIWMHMEYKYFLGLLKSQLYEEFIIDFKNGAVPFMREEIYGRSLFENSSFIASSANPDQKIHGKGFVARLSGSTAEFLNIWQIMMFGERPFRYIEDELLLSFTPLIPSYLIDEHLTIEAVFLGSVRVIYILEDRGDYIPNEYLVESYTITGAGESAEVMNASIDGVWSRRIRDGKAERIEVILKRI